MIWSKEPTRIYMNRKHIEGGPVRDDISVRLKQMLDAVLNLETHAKRGRNSFFGDTSLQEAVVRELKALAVAADALPPDFKRRNHGVPWRSLVEMRTTRIRKDVDHDKKDIWSFIQKRLAVVAEDVRRMRERLPKG